MFSLSRESFRGPNSSSRGQQGGGGGGEARLVTALPDRTEESAGAC